MSQVKRIAIIGAGVAGMSLAILAAEKGFQVELYERQSDISSMGAGVTLWPNAIWVLDKMGLKERAIAVGGQPRFMRQFDVSGRQISELDIEAVNRISSLTSVTILRRDLMTLLAQRLAEKNIRIQFDTAMDADDIHSLKQKADLVVAADGRMNSVGRRMLFADDAEPQYQGFINLIGISPLDDGSSAAKCLSTSIQDYRGEQERFGIVPVSDGLCYWAAAWPDTGGSPEEMRQRSLSVNAWRHQLYKRFGHWPEPVAQTIRDYAPASLKAIFVHDLNPLPRWHQDNLLLLGDSAHAPLPTSGQGACQALEDAWHLVDVLTGEQISIGEPCSLENRLSMFYQRRIGKTTLCQNIGRQVAQGIFKTAGVKASAGAPLTESGPVVISPQQLNDLWMKGLE
ncbi:FAD-dependent monooxygenase [Oceanospirillum sp. HFRX-1_2]